VPKNYQALGIAQGQKPRQPAKDRQSGQAAKNTEIKVIQKKAANAAIREVSASRQRFLQAIYFGLWKEFSLSKKIHQAFIRKRAANRFRRCLHTMKFQEPGGSASPLPPGCQ
jgi:hypothetical protein